MNTKVYYLNIKDKPLAPKQINSLTDYRQQRLSRLKSDESKKQCAYAELLLKYALSENRLEFGDYLVSESGKPYFEKGVHFSLSHSKNYVACAVSDFSVGVDIECRAPSDNVIIRMNLDKANAILDWTKKEAVSKKSGQGISGMLNGINSYDGNVFSIKVEHGYLSVCCEDTPDFISVDGVEV